jgi:hypothetical protein
VTIQAAVDENDTDTNLNALQYFFGNMGHKVLRKFHTKILLEFYKVDPIATGLPMPGQESEQ